MRCLARLGPPRCGRSLPRDTRPSWTKWRAGAAVAELTELAKLLHRGPLESGARSASVGATAREEVLLADEDALARLELAAATGTGTGVGADAATGASTTAGGKGKAGSASIGAGWHRRRLGRCLRQARALWRGRSAERARQQGLRPLPDWGYGWSDPDCRDAARCPSPSGRMMALAPAPAQLPPPGRRRARFFRSSWTSFSAMFAISLRQATSPTATVRKG